ncbi:unnamed protein product [Lampetra fluviatilis]
MEEEVVMMTEEVVMMTMEEEVVVVMEEAQGSPTLRVDLCGPWRVPPHPVQKLEATRVCEAVVHTTNPGRSKFESSP